MNQGEWYRAHLVYTYYDSSGNQQTKEIYSDYFCGGDNDNSIVIWNLKSLLDWTWRELMEIEITYEGFTITFKQIFLFSLIAPTVILFVIYFIGTYSVGFMFGRGSVKPVKNESVETADINTELDPDKNGLGWENVGK